jgi:glycosyltransferase involved in cell wall biosynthesis
VRVAFHIDQLWFSPPGGIGTYVWELGSALMRLDPPVDLRPFHSRWPEPAPRMWTLRQPPVEVPAPIRTLYPRWDLTGRPALPSTLADAAVVHATNPAAVPPVGFDQRLVVTIHDLAYERFPHTFPREWRWLYRTGVRRAVRRAAAILTPSRATAEDLLDRTGIDAGRVHVTPLAPSLAAGGPAPELTVERLRLPRPYVLNVGTIEPRKNLLLLVRAFRRLAAEGLPHTLVLAGPPGWKAQGLRRELSVDAPGTIVRTNLLSEAELDAVYRCADAFVYPSLYEGFGLPVLEAMSRGIPCVVSTASSLPEVAGDAALGIDPTDQDSLADALARILTDRALADDLSRRGRDRAASFSWDRTARDTLDVYREVTA